MTLPGRITTMSSALGFDTDTVLNFEIAKQFYNDGYRFCLRYLSLGTPEGKNELSYHEALSILQAGLGLMAVQHVPYSGWSPTANLGTIYGTNAAKNSKAVGLPPGVNIWCDLEGVSNIVDADTVIAYCNNWYDAVVKAGYVPGLYVGSGAILDGAQLYYNLKFQHYWQSASEVPEVAVRGYQLVQSAPNARVNGIAVDKDMAQIDNCGGQIQCLVDVP